MAATWKMHIGQIHAESSEDDELLSGSRRLCSGTDSCLKYSSSA